MKTYHSSTRCRARGAVGFTLLELVIGVMIMTVLSMVGVGLMGVMKEKAKMARELSAGRNLMTAFHLYSAENNGEVLHGYKSAPGAVNEAGQLLSTPMNARYPWRLFPYIRDVQAALLFNGNEEVLGGQHSDYLVSVVPNLGMNTTFVGGHFGSGSLLRPTVRIEEKLGRFAVRNSGDMSRAADVIAFASARSEPDEDWAGHGYFEVQPPKVMGDVWGKEPWEPDSAPGMHGFVDFRWGGKAVATMLDGSARLMDESEMRDMRHWCIGAAEADDPNYVVFSR